jgi:molecular chaperone IbpA
VVKLNDDQFIIELALVGFKEKDLDLAVHDGILTIKGNREHRRNQELYVHKGISGRKFERSFRLSEFVEVTGADLEDGLLSIRLERILPEEKRPRKIAINQSIKGENKDDNNAKLLNESN